jgi:tetratricopeptide (TPR) repeat protein
MKRRHEQDDNDEDEQPALKKQKILDFESITNKYIQCVKDTIEKFDFTTVPNEVWRQIPKQHRSQVFQELKKVLRTSNDTFHVLSLKYGISQTAYYHYIQLEELDQCITRLLELPTSNSQQNLLAIYYNLRGWTKSEVLHKYEDSLIDYTKAVTIRPTFTKAVINRANALSELKKSSEAIDDYNYSLNYDQNNPLIYHNRSFSYEDIGLRVNALSDAAVAYKICPEDEDYLENYTFIRERLRVSSTHCLLNE